ncbi:hypothetical protein D3C86_971430 [compost metagenome]
MFYSFLIDSKRTLHFRNCALRMRANKPFRLFWIICNARFRNFQSQKRSNFHLLLFAVQPSVLAEFANLKTIHAFQHAKKRSPHLSVHRSQIFSFKHAAEAAAQIMAPSVPYCYNIMQRFPFSVIIKIDLPLALFITA